MIVISNHLTVLVVAGASSNSGKTTLVGAMLRHLTAATPWEAIKVTRGHYRSCGKDPHACCVSDLLGAAATVRSGRAQTYARGKDTGRYWDASASNVHWVIATDEQVEAGTATALARVQTLGVIIEGTSVLRYLEPAYTVLAVAEAVRPWKASARWALATGKVDALYLADAQRLPRLAEADLQEKLAALPAYDATGHAALFARLAEHAAPLPFAA